MWGNLVIFLGGQLPLRGGSSHSNVKYVRMVGKCEKCWNQPEPTTLYRGNGENEVLAGEYGTFESVLIRINVSTRSWSVEYRLVNSLTRLRSWKGSQVDRAESKRTGRRWNSTCLASQIWGIGSSIRVESLLMACCCWRPRNWKDFVVGWDKGQGDNFFQVRSLVLRPLDLTFHPGVVGSVSPNFVSQEVLPRLPTRPPNLERREKTDISLCVYRPARVGFFVLYFRVQVW